tara:strand:+ start:473 stop:874 length:402 start_codon:yes stop_codon:yes gene_type:complete
MAHFTKLGKGNIVEEVHVVNNEVITDNDGNEQEQLGVDFLNNLHKTNVVWKQTSYNGSFRKNYAGIGYTYDEERDAFIPPQPYKSWIIDEDTCTWKAPIDKPITYEKNLKDNDDNPVPDKYVWNETYYRWDLF